MNEEVTNLYKIEEDLLLEKPETAEHDLLMEKKLQIKKKIFNLRKSVKD